MGQIARYGLIFGLLGAWTATGTAQRPDSATVRERLRVTDSLFAHLAPGDSTGWRDLRRLLALQGIDTGITACPMPVMRLDSTARIPTTAGHDSTPPVPMPTQRSRCVNTLGIQRYRYP